MNWENKRFIDFIQLQRGHDLTKEQFVYGPYPVVSSTSVIGYHNEYKAKGPGIVIGRSGTLGKVQYIHENYWPHNTALYVKDYKNNYPKFVYYFLTNFATDKHGGGAAVPTLNRNSLSDILIKVPDINTQRQIANILSAYDDLIENNQKQIKLLEEAAMRLYKEWFVNLRFPGYETVKIVDGVPEGWVDCVLSDAVEFNPVIKLLKNNKSKKVPMAALSTSLMTLDEGLISDTVLKTGTVFCNNDTLLARITPCLENGKTAFVNFLEEGKSAVGSTEFIVMRSKNLNPFLIYCLARSVNFRSQAINSMTGADGRQRVKIETLKNIKYLLPSKLIIDLCKEHMEPAFNKIKILNKQIHLLQQTRDKLLPKLMNGEIDIPEE